jgi:hypothetical protein
MAEVRSRRIVLWTAPSQPAAVTDRAQFAARRLAGIGEGSTVVVAALLGPQLLLVHPAAEVVRLLRRTHACGTLLPNSATHV